MLNHKNIVQKFKINNEILLDDFCLQGRSEDDFEAYLQQIDSHRRYITVRTENIMFLSIREIIEEQKCIICDVCFTKMQYNEHGNLVIPLKKIDVSKMVKKGHSVDVDILIKMCVETKLLLLITSENADKSKIYFISKYAYNFFADIAGINGKTMAEASFQRNFLLAKNFRKRDEINFIIRNFDGINKIFSCVGSRYRSDDLCDEYGEFVSLKHSIDLGKIECDVWKIMHKRIRVGFLLCEYGKQLNDKYDLNDDFMPYVVFETSDIGEESATLKIGWKMRKSGMKIIFAAFRCRHRGQRKYKRVTADTERKSAEAEKLDVVDIYKSMRIEFEIYAEKLVSIRRILLDPTEFVRKGKRGENRYFHYLTNIYKDVFHELALPSGIMSKRSVKTAVEGLANKNCTLDHSYSAYDLVLDIFNLPTYAEEESKVCEESRRKFGEKVVKLLNVDYVKLQNKYRSRQFDS